MRVIINLNHQEFERLRRLPPWPGEAWNFWRGVARDRGLDPDTIMYVNGEPTGMKLGHGKPWCWPIPLPCRVRRNEHGAPA